MSQHQAVDDGFWALKQKLKYVGTNRPRGLEKLKQTRWESRSFGMIDILMVILSIPFFALAGISIKVNGTVVEEHQWLFLDNAMKATGTFFPIVFATIVGRVSVKAAAWRLERGDNLGKIEQLLGSRTIFGAITTQFQMRSYNLLAFGMVVVWILSPLGGQAGSRLLWKVNRLHESSTQVAYFDSYNSPSEFASFPAYLNDPDNDDHFNRVLGYINMVYAAAVTSAPYAMNSSMDIRNNVKIPCMSSYSNATVAEWVSTPRPESLQYSSLQGIPISGLNGGINTFVLKSTHTETECSSATLEAPISFISGMLLSSVSTPENSEQESFDPSAIANGTLQSASTPTSGGHWILALDTFINTTVWNTSVAEFRPTPDFFANQPDINTETGALAVQIVSSSVVNASANDELAPNLPGPPGSTVYCKLKQVNIESNVSCLFDSVSSEQNCTIVAQRLSPDQHAPPSITPFSFPTLFYQISMYIPDAIDAKNTGNSSGDASMRYLENRLTARGQGNIGDESQADFTGVPADVLGYRIGQLINSYYMISQQGIIDQANYPPNVSATARVTTSAIVYSVSVPWFVVLLFSTLVMFGVAVLGSIVSRITTAPDVLGYASSLVRDSRYIDLPLESGMLDGIELSRLLKNQRVRFGAVEKSAIGGDHLAVIVMGEVLITT
ncbi:hypothetical protein N431DRAFT_451542 [Stipitochalara longipes BDJ]|nr:hypothetical protein N431DRAFT_451542 [Stipitochalara longipes BDJ]